MIRTFEIFLYNACRSDTYLHILISRRNYSLDERVILDQYCVVLGLIHLEMVKVYQAFARIIEDMNHSLDTDQRRRDNDELVLYSDSERSNVAGVCAHDSKQTVIILPSSLSFNS